MAILLSLVVVGLVVFLFLRPQAGTPIVLAPTSSGISGFEQKLISAWITHSQTWKRWIVFIAGIGVGLLVSTFIGG